MEKAMNDPILILQDKVIAVSVMAGVAREKVHAEAMAYALPSIAWIQGPLADWGTRALDTLGVVYTPDGFHCTAYTLFYAAHVNIAHQRTPVDDSGTVVRRDDKLCIGFFNYTTKLLEGHSCMVAVTREEPTKLSFFEPQQRMKQLYLSSTEIASCRLEYFG